MGDVMNSYDGYFSVIIPDNLKKLLNGDVLKLRDSVTEFSEFLKTYGETASVVENEFTDDKNPNFWIYYHSMSFAFPDNKVMVGIKTTSEKMFRNIQQGIVAGRFKIYLRGTAKVSKDDIEGVDKHLVKITIQKVEGYWDGKLHSSSPVVDRIFNVRQEPKVLKISDLSIVNDGDVEFIIDEPYVDKYMIFQEWLDYYKNLKS